MVCARLGAFARCAAAACVTMRAIACHKHSARRQVQSKSSWLLATSSLAHIKETRAQARINIGCPALQALSLTFVRNSANGLVDVCWLQV